MRRRVREGADDNGGMPLSLTRYAAADWPNPDCHPECAFWEAVGEWREDHPMDLDGTDSTPLIIHGPDVPWHPEWV